MTDDTILPFSFPAVHTKKLTAPSMGAPDLKWGRDASCDGRAASRFGRQFGPGVPGPARSDAAVRSRIQAGLRAPAGHGPGFVFPSDPVASKMRAPARRSRPPAGGSGSAARTRSARPILTATQERPIFSASRRPPQRAVIAAPGENASAAAPQKAAEPEHPPLALIGAVVGESDAIAVFLDRTNQKIVRWRQGEAHAEWVDSSILPRGGHIQEGRFLSLSARTVLRALLARRRHPVWWSRPRAALTPPMPTFVPRSTPKHGESDSLSSPTRRQDLVRIRPPKRASVLAEHPPSRAGSVRNSRSTSAARSSRRLSSPSR